MELGIIRFFFSFVLVLQLLFWVCVTSRPFAPNHQHPALPPQGTAHSPQSLQFTLTSEQGQVGYQVKEAVTSYGGVSKIGSSPPSCAHKCYGCNPCEATQVPTITSHVGIQYTNYEPEGWKCKCGPTFYSP